MKANLRNDIDMLIDWYEKNRPSSGKEIAVNATIKDIAKACAIMLPPKKDGEPQVKSVVFRGRTLLAVK